jgi:hypothetical protein
MRTTILGGGETYHTASKGDVIKLEKDTDHIEIHTSDGTIIVTGDGKIHR